jgi:hypothetical protein
MGKLKTATWKWITTTITLLTLLVLGGLFASKTTTSLAVLKYIPSLIHPVVGWILIALGLIQFLIVLVLAIVKAVK